MGGPPDVPAGARGSDAGAESGGAVAGGGDTTPSSRIGTTDVGTSGRGWSRATISPIASLLFQRADSRTFRCFSSVRCGPSSLMPVRWIEPSSRPAPDTLRRAFETARGAARRGPEVGGRHCPREMGTAKPQVCDVGIPERVYSLLGGCAWRVASALQKKVAERGAGRCKQEEIR